MVAVGKGPWSTCCPQSAASLGRQHHLLPGYRRSDQPATYSNQSGIRQPCRNHPQVKLTKKSQEAPKKDVTPKYATEVKPKRSPFCLLKEVLQLLPFDTRRKVPHKDLRMDMSRSRTRPFYITLLFTFTFSMAMRGCSPQQNEFLMYKCNVPLAICLCDVPFAYGMGETWN